MSRLPVLSPRGWVAGAVLLGVFCFGLSSFGRRPPRSPQQDRAEADAFFTNGGLHKLRLEISPQGLDSLRREPRKPVKAILREDDRVYDEVSVHLKGSAGSFRPVDDPKPGFTLNFTHFESGARFHGLRKFHINNSVQDGTWLSDMIAADIFRGAGVPAPRYGHAVVELNGRRLGLCVIMEALDRDFLSRYFQNPRGNLYGQAGGCEITDHIERMEGSGPLDWADLRPLIQAVQQGDAVRRWDQMQKALDVDRFLSFMAVEVILCDWDGYTFARHNYRVYHDLDTDRCVFMPHDKDQIMGDPNVPIMPGVQGMVAQAVLNTPEPKRLYRERIEQVFTNVFKVQVLTNRICQTISKIEPTLKAYDANLARDFVNNANSLRDRIVNRAEGLARQFPPPAKKTP